MMALVTNQPMSYLLRFLKDETFVWLIDIYAKMQHKDNYLDEAVKLKNNRYAERCNAAGLNFMACAFETTGAICMEVTPLIDVTLRNSRISRSS